MNNAPQTSMNASRGLTLTAERDRRSVECSSRIFEIVHALQRLRADAATRFVSQQEMDAARTRTAGMVDEVFDEIARTQAAQRQRAAWAGRFGYVPVRVEGACRINVLA